MNRNELKNIKIKLNGKHQGGVKTGTEALNYILSLGMEDLKYFSQDAIENWIKEALDMAEEILEWGKDISLKKRVEMYRKALTHTTDRESAVNLFVNMTLSCEGLGTLSGFGMANVDSNKGRMKAKSKIWTNPERKSYRN